MKYQEVKKSLSDIHRKCTKPNHQDQQIVMVCLNNECSSNLFCCCLCVDEEHPAHKLISFRKFQHILHDRIQLNSKNAQRVKILNQFEQYRAMFTKALKKLQNEVLSQIYTIQHQLNILFQMARKTLTFSSEVQIIDELSQNFDSQNWKRIIQQTQVCQKIRIGTAKDNLKILSHQLFIFNQRIQQVKTSITQQLKQLKSEVECIKFSSRKYEDSPKFHHIHKYFDISRLDSGSEIEKKKNNGNRAAALGNRPLDPINNSVKFRIIKNGDGIPSICVGAAILNILKKNNYTNCTGNKRGVYCIDQAMTNNWGSIQLSNQATFWNHDQQNSSNTIGFQFTEGDIVAMTVDFENSTIIFEKDEEIFDMMIDCTHRDLYPFVCLNNTNAVVEILQ